MALHLPTFFTRLGSAIVFSAIMMAGLLWNEWSFMALVTLIMLLCLRELFRLEEKLHGNPRSSSITAVVFIFAVLLITLAGFQCFYPSVLFDVTRYEQSNVPVPPFALSHNPAIWPCLLFVPAVLLLAGFLSKKDQMIHALFSIGSLCYIVLPCVLLVFLYRIHWVIPLVMVLMLWMNDTMAYLVGSFIGKTPFSKISPKKTWEGTGGGVVLTILGAAVWGYYAPYYRMIDWMMLALFVSTAGTAGDLLESRLKRMAEVKDSGTMMPGHGGALDRFDSLLVATPFVYCYAYLFMQPVPPVNI